MKELDPLLKLILIIWSLVYFMLFNSLLPIIMGFLLVIIVSSLEFSLRKIFRMAYGMKYWFLLILILQILIFKSLDLTFYFVIMLKLISYWLSFGLLFLNVDSGELLDTLERIRMPRFLAGSIAITISLVERYYQDLVKIKKILSLRGFYIDVKKPFQTARNLYNLLLPVFVLASFRSKTTSIALLTKNWGYPGKRTKYRSYKFKAKDYALLFSMLLLTFFSWFLKTVDFNFSTILLSNPV